MKNREHTVEYRLDDLEDSISEMPPKTEITLTVQNVKDILEILKKVNGNSRIFRKSVLDN